MLKTTTFNSLRVDKLVSFVQHDLPGLKSGRYRLELSQKLSSGEKTISDDTLSAHYTLAVCSDRFHLSTPAETLYSVFPPENSSGRFDTVLPSVVFAKTSFPWARSPLTYKNADQETADETDSDVPTWLTVLLLDEADCAEYANWPGFTGESEVRTVGDLFPPRLYPASTLGDHFSYFNEVVQENTTWGDCLEPGQQPTDKILTLDIPVPLFKKLIPTVVDLNYMAHIRQVSLINKATIAGISDVGEPEGSFSIVFGNRLPGSNRQTRAFLVSLEGMEAYLPTEEDANRKINDREDEKFLIRLAVLHRWSFFSAGNQATFVDCLKRLNGGPGTGTDINEDLHLPSNLRLPVPEGAVRQVSDALQLGFVPFKHHLRSAVRSGETVTGEKTVSWYRGPLCPYRIDSSRIHPPLVSADQATLYDPTTGMFDLSYACAWSLGRQLTIEDKPFATMLYNWKKEIDLDIQKRTERDYLQAVFAPVFGQRIINLRSENRPTENRSFIQQALFAVKEKK